MAVISGDSDRAYLGGAMALERGRSAREREAMRPGITPHNAEGEDNAQGGAAGQEARTRAARRHAVDGSRSFERHHSDVLADDPQLAQRVLSEERRAASKRLAAGA